MSIEQAVKAWNEATMEQQIAAIGTMVDNNQRFSPHSLNPSNEGQCAATLDEVFSDPQRLIAALGETQ